MLLGEDLSVRRMERALGKAGEVAKDVFHETLQLLRAVSDLTAVAHARASKGHSVAAKTERRLGERPDIPVMLDAQDLAH